MGVIRLEGQLIRNAVIEAGLLVIVEVERVQTGFVLGAPVVPGPLTGEGKFLIRLLESTSHVHTGIGRKTVREIVVRIRERRTQGVAGESKEVIRCSFRAVLKIVHPQRGAQAELTGKVDIAGPLQGRSESGVPVIAFLLQSGVLGDPGGGHIADADPAEAAAADTGPKTTAAVIQVAEQVAGTRARSGVDGSAQAFDVLLLGNDVDDAAGTFRIVLRRRTGDDFHLLDLIGRDHLQRVSDIGRHERAGFVVDQDTDILGSLQ